MTGMQAATAASSLGAQCRELADSHINWFGSCGAPEENNLEPSNCVSILEELESWTAILKAEPDVCTQLRKLSDSDDVADSPNEPEPSP